jgi:hypothetical protein
MYWQKTPEEVNEEALDALELRHDMWPVTANKG